MDIVLDVSDSLILDRIWASLLPNAQLSIVEGCSLKKHSEEGCLDFPNMQQNISIPISSGNGVYTSHWPRENIYRQFVSLFFITVVFAYLLYFSTAAVIYAFFYDKSTLQNPKFRKNQIRQEIYESILSIPWMSLFTIPVFLMDVRGYSMLYDDNGPGLWYEILQFPLFVVVTDAMNYWIHRTLHHPFLCKHLHKQHHKWVVATPFAGYAFHPLDGFAQSIPYHVFIFVFPMNKWEYLPIWVVCNIWTIAIHEGEFVSDSKVFNSPACHTVHHLRFFYNFGQFFTLWDRIGGTYRNPYEELDLEDKDGQIKVNSDSIKDLNQEQIILLWKDKGKKKLQ